MPAAGSSSGHRGPQLMLGYWNDPGLTDAQFVEAEGSRWFVTGDTVNVDSDGYYFYFGRDDDVIGSSGYRIGPQEVENALIEHPAVQESAVVGLPDADRGQIVTAFVILASGSIRARRSPRSFRSTSSASPRRSSIHGGSSS